MHQVLFCIAQIIFTLCHQVDYVASQFASSGSVFTLAGETATFKCLPTNGNALSWTVHHLNGETCELSAQPARGTLPRCAASDRATLLTLRESMPEYGLTFVAYLTVRNVSLLDAGSYICNGATAHGYQGQGSSSLTVLESAPSGDWTPTYVVAGENLTLTCRAVYNGSSSPRVTWTTGSGGTVPNGSVVTSRVTGNARDTLMHLVSTLSIRVETSAVRIEPFICNVNLPVSTQSVIGGTTSSYTWNSLAIVVSYCPRNVAILSTDDVITLGTQLRCVSEAYPVADYRWIVIAGSGFVSGRYNDTLTVMSTGENGNRYHVMCTAVNYLRGSAGEPCFASTEIQEFDEVMDEGQDISSTELKIATSTMESVDVDRRPHDRTSRSEQSSIERSFTDQQHVSPDVSGYQTAVFVLSILMGAVITALVVMGTVLARVVAQLRRHATPRWRPVECHNSAKSLTTEMSSLTCAATDCVTSS
jgi:hypothetical protein